MGPKLTKQGVRDLSHLKGKSAGVKVEFTGPVVAACKHRRTRQLLNGSAYCEDCGERLDLEPYKPEPDPDYD